METVNKTTIDIQTGLSAVLESKKTTYPCHVNRISSMDDPCVRRLYYARTAWDKAEPTENSLQGIFETGNLLEPVIERIVSEVGGASTPAWRIVGSQITTNDMLLKQYQISGTIDGFLQVMTEHGTWDTLGVIDIKTMSANIFNTINNYSSLLKYPWTRKYRGQLMLYSLAHNLETCFTLLVNKNNLYDMKLIEFPLDMDYCEGLLKKAAAVNQAIQDETPPVKLNDSDECPRCKFASFCCPDFTTGKEMQISDNGELEAIMNRLEELDPLASEYAELEKQRDALLIKGQDVVCGKWLVTWKKTVTEYKSKTAYTLEGWRKKIVKV